MRRRIDLPVIVIVLLALLICGRGLLPGNVFSSADILYATFPWRALESRVDPQNTLLSDEAFQFQPWQIYTASQIRAGHFPLWNPHAFGGAPFLGNPQSAILFPYSALAYVMPVSKAQALEAVLKIATAGLAMYWMLRVLDLRSIAALAGAIAFMFNGFLIVWLGWPVTNVAIWLPFLIGLTERLRQSLRWQYAGYLALVIGIVLLGGHPETSFHVLFVCGCYAVYRLRGRSPVRYLMQFAMAAVLGGTLAAVQLLPFLDYLSHSAIIAIRQPGVVRATLPIRAIMALLVPNYFGSPVTGNFWGPANYNEIANSVGVLPLILLSCAVLGGWKRIGTKFFCTMAIFSAAVIYNFYPVLWVLSKVPGFSRAANHRLIVALTFSMAALCGIGMEVLLSAPDKIRSRLAIGLKASLVLLLTMSVVWGVLDYQEILAKDVTEFVASQVIIFVLLLIAATYVSLRLLNARTGAAKLVLVLVGIEFLSFLPVVPFYNPVIGTDNFYPTTPALEYLRADRSVFRVSLPMPNLGAVYGLSDMAGYDAMTPTHLVQLLNAAASLGDWGNAPLWYTEDLNSRITDLLNLKYVLRPPGAPSPGAKFSVAYDGPDARIFQNREVFSRAFMVGRARTCLDDVAAVAAIRGAEINLRQEIVVSDCADLPAGDSDQSAPVVKVYEPERVVVDATVRNAGFLVLTDTYDAGWRVKVDNREARMLRADEAFRAVALGPGSHRVEFLYRPLSLRLGLIVSILGLVGALALVYVGACSKLNFPMGRP
jgi:hypothetical protein